MLNDAIFRKVLDADFHNVMKGVGFALTPREHITVGEMITYYQLQQAMEVINKNSIYGVEEL